VLAIIGSSAHIPCNGAGKKTKVFLPVAEDLVNVVKFGFLRARNPV
jgi:hypothetical protein